ncbi:hypothetical protein CbuD7D7780_10320 [Coxiella burnetii]|nr:hypothetical protein [Coxiella burnetii]OYK79468.1 hypothetical protein CbuD7E6568_10305 [Coxiella burnetii]OYK81549.1 hypothetical protein CbuD7D7780_10320 [Coxiella burnetii]
MLILALRLLKAGRPAVEPRDDDANIRIAGGCGCN